MSVQYSCFISYPRCGTPVVDRFVEIFLEKLEGEILSLTRQKAFLDTREIGLGAEFPKEIAQAICRSACWIVILTPRYFDADKHFCVREFVHATKVQRARMKSLKDEDVEVSRFTGRIIPIMLRGEMQAYPREITQVINLGDFSRYDHDVHRKRLPAHYMEHIRQIASIVSNHCRILGNELPHLFAHCEEAELPEEADDSVVAYMAEARAKWLAHLQTLPSRTRS